MTQSDRPVPPGGAAGPAPAVPPLEVVGPPQAPAVEGASAGPTTVLLVAAHPDDPEFSSGGTIARWVAAGVHVIYVLVTSGDKGTPDKTMTNERLAGMRSLVERQEIRWWLQQQLDDLARVAARR